MLSRQTSKPIIPQQKQKKKPTPSKPIAKCIYCGKKFEDTGCFEGRCQLGQQNDIRNYFNFKKQ